MDLAGSMPELVAAMVERVRELARDLVEPDNPDTVGVES